MADEQMTEEKNEISEALLTSARLAIRVNGNYFDSEIEDLISAARRELTEIGVKAEKVNDDSDPLVKRAIITYVKAEFGLDNPDAARYRESFDKLRHHMSLSSNYREDDTDVLE